MKLVLNKFYILQFQRYFLKKYLIECNIYEKFLHNVNENNKISEDKDFVQEFQY